MKESLLKTPAAAAHLGVSPNQVRKLVATDKTFPRPRVFGPRILLFSPSALDRWVAERRGPSAAGESL